MVQIVILQLQCFPQIFEVHVDLHFFGTSELLKLVAMVLGKSALKHGLVALVIVVRVAGGVVNRVLPGEGSLLVQGLSLRLVLGSKTELVGQHTVVNSLLGHQVL